MKKPEHVFVDLHVLQTLPPSCVNSDEMGNPKTAVYGGVTRARVSSQSWKRAMRIMFNDLFDDEDIGKRTKMPGQMIAAKIAELDPNLDADKLAEKALELAEAPYKAFVCAEDDCMDSLGEHVTVPEMLDLLEQGVSELLAKEDL